jgi:hypothetical protein
MGQLIEIIQKTTYTFDARASTTQDVVLKDFVNTVGFSSGVVVVRVHVASGFATGATARVQIYNQSRDRDDPGVFFTDAAIATATIAATDSGKLKVASFTPPISSMVRVMLQWVQGANVASNQSLTIAVDLVGRE